MDFNLRGPHTPAMPPEEDRGTINDTTLGVTSSVHHALRESPKVPRSIREMRCIFFEDEPGQRRLMDKILPKIGFLQHEVFDTDVAENKEREQELIDGADCVITDINDAESASDPAGGLRRGEMALAAGKIVIFVTGRDDNQTVIEQAFAEKYPGQYAYIMKPFQIPSLQNVIQNLIDQRNARLDLE